MHTAMKHLSSVLFLSFKVALFMLTVFMLTIQSERPQ